MIRLQNYLELLVLSKFGRGKYNRGNSLIATIGILVFLVSITISTHSAYAQSLSLYVATNGNDLWSGRFASPNLEKTDGPFASLERARNEIRKSDILVSKGATVFIRGGTYYLSRTFKLNILDSGTKDAPIVFRAFEGEKPVLVGGKIITGFTPYKGAIVKADVAKHGFEGKYFRQLFLNGKRQVLARYPNFDNENPFNGGYAYVDGESQNMYQNLPKENLRIINLRERDNRSWKHQGDAEVVIFPRYNWHNWIIPIKAINHDFRTITLAKDAFRGIRPQDRYYVRNHIEELDAPGEWYLDRESWTLYFWPPEQSDNITAYAPMVENLIEIGPNTKWITIKGLSLECSDGNGILLDRAGNCRIEGNIIHNIGGSISKSAAVNIIGGKQCHVAGNDIYDVDNDGIRISGGNFNTLEPGAHVVDNNYIHHIGELNGHACGIVLDGVGNNITHNLIHDTARCGIFGGGNDSVIEFNHIRHVGLVTEDTGGIYLNGNWNTRGTIIRHNYIHDVLGFGRNREGKWVSPYNAYGIYLDDNHSGAYVNGNIVTRATSGNIFIHSGRDNILENNILVDGFEQQVIYAGYDMKNPLILSQYKEFNKYRNKPAYLKYPKITEMNIDTAGRMVGNKFLRNIIVYNNPEAKLFTTIRNNFPEQNEFDYNLIWNNNRSLRLDLARVPQEKQWQEWKKRGFDKHSIVADPKFIDSEHGDYRLGPGSPAFKLGFQDIPVDRIGPYKSPARASWPIVELAGAREKPYLNR